MICGTAIRSRDTVTSLPFSKTVHVHVHVHVHVYVHVHVLPELNVVLFLFATYR